MENDAGIRINIDSGFLIAFDFRKNRLINDFDFRKNVSIIAFDFRKYYLIIAFDLCT